MMVQMEAVGPWENVEINNLRAYRGRRLDLQASGPQVRAGAGLMGGLSGGEQGERRGGEVSCQVLTRLDRGRDVGPRDEAPSRPTKRLKRSWLRAVSFCRNMFACGPKGSDCLVATLPWPSWCGQDWKRIPIDMNALEEQ